MPFELWKSFRPVTDDAPALLRKAGHSLRTQVAPLIAEILIADLEPAPEDFLAPTTLAEALEKRALLIEKATQEYNKSRGNIPLETQTHFIGVSRLVEDGIKGLADASQKFLVEKNQEEFRRIAAHKMKSVLSEVTTALDSARKVEITLLGLKEKSKSK